MDKELALNGFEKFVKKPKEGISVLFESDIWGTEEDLHNRCADDDHGLPLGPVQGQNGEEGLKDGSVEKSEVQGHGQSNGIDKHHVLPNGEGQERLARGEGVHGVEHLNDDQDRERDSRAGLGHIVGEHGAANLRELGRTAVEVRQLVEADLGTLRVEHEPPNVTGDRGETDVGTDDEITEEEPSTDELLVTLSGVAAHDIVVRRVEGQSSGGETVGDQVDPQKLNRDQSLGHAESGRQEDRDDLTDVGRDEVADELLGVVVDGAALLNGDLDGGEVIIGENHISSKLRDVSAGTHSNTDISLLQSRRIVDTVTSHGNDLTEGLKEINQLGLVGRLNTREQRSRLGGLELLTWAEVIELPTSIALASQVLVRTKDTDLTADALSGVAVVTGDNDDTDTGILALPDRSSNFRARRIKHTDKTDESKVLLERGVFGGRLGGVKKRVSSNVVQASQSDDTQTTVAVFNNLLHEQFGHVTIEVNLPAIGAEESVSAAFDEGFRSTLNEKLLLTITLNQNGHALAVTGELVCGKALVLLLIPGASVVNAILRMAIDGGARTNLLSQNTEGTFGSFTDVRESVGRGVIVKTGIVAESGDLGQLKNGSRILSKIGNLLAL